MSEIRDIVDALKRLAVSATSDYIKFQYATVSSVDEDARTCDATVIDGDSDIEIRDISLMAEPNDGLLKIPAVGSEIIIGYNRTDSPFMVVSGELDKVIVNTNTLFQFNKGLLVGLVKIEALVTKVNNLENAYNDLVEKYNLHTHAGVQTGAGSSAVTTSLETTILVPTEQAEIEDTKVIH